MLNEIFNVAKRDFRTDSALLILPDASPHSEAKAGFRWAEKNVKLTSARLLVPIMEIIPLFKHSSFNDENEWGIVQLGSESHPTMNSIFYRPRLDSLVLTVGLDIKGSDGHVPDGTHSRTWKSSECD